MRQETRKNILKVNKVFTTHLISVQSAKYALSNYEYSEGESVILDDSDKSVILTKVQADELNAEQRDYFNSNKDFNPFNPVTEAKPIGDIKFISRKTNTNAYLLDIGIALDDLRKNTKNEDLIILGDCPTPWLYQENDYKPVKEAQDWLKKYITTEFNGGFLLRDANLIQFIPRLFWLIRCNAALPEFLMTFGNYNTIFSVCRYGVLHIESYDKDELNSIVDFFNKRKFKQIDNCSDPIEFDDLDGRQIMPGS